MPGSKQDWWTDTRVEATVTPHFVYSQLNPDDAEKLTLRVFVSFSTDTYLEWITKKARRLFLSLVESGCAGHIFHLVDNSYDDEDLPISEAGIGALRLPHVRGQQTDQRFYRNQFKFLHRVINDLEHIRYAKSENVPLQVIASKNLSSISNSELSLVPSKPPRVALKRTTKLDEERLESSILSEIAGLHAIRHQHCLSVMASYTYDSEFYTLITPATKHNFKSFLNDFPKSFEALPKLERRTRFLDWANCLSNALAWLHSTGFSHGAIRPSRILIDDEFTAYLGPFEGDGILGSTTTNNDLEAYHYGAPELWRREMTVQHSGQETGRFFARGVVNHHAANEGSDNDNLERSRTRDDASRASPSLKSYTFLPSSKGNSSRLTIGPSIRQIETPPPFSFRTESRASARPSVEPEQLHGLGGLGRRLDAMSLRSSNSSDSGSKTPTSQKRQMYFIPAETKKAIVQTWKSASDDLPASDVFALSAVIMDLLSAFCSRSVSSFARHRSSKNRQAGRGGGVADASFHANLPQCATWAEMLHKDAEKKLKKQEGSIFGVVGPMLQILIQCLDREPPKRMRSQLFATRMRRHIAEFGGLEQTHCELELPDIQPEKVELPVPEKRSKVPPRAPRHDSVPSESSTTKTITRPLEEYLVTIAESQQRGHDQLAHGFDINVESPSQTSASERATLNLDPYDDYAPGLDEIKIMPNATPKASSCRLRITPSEEGSPPSLYSQTTKSRCDESLPCTPDLLCSTQSLQGSTLRIAADYHMSIVSRSSTGPTLSRSSSRQQLSVKPDSARGSGQISSLAINKKKLDEPFAMHPGNRLSLHTPPRIHRRHTSSGVEHVRPDDVDFTTCGLGVYGLQRRDEDVRDRATKSQ